MAKQKIRITVFTCTCDICGHQWRTEGTTLPDRCSSKVCRSKVWDRKAIKAGRPRRPRKLDA